MSKNDAPRHVPTDTPTQPSAPDAGAGGGTVTLTAAQFEALLSRATSPSLAPHGDIAALVDAIERRHPAQQTGLSDERLAVVMSPAKPPRYRTVLGIGPEGATFGIRVKEVAGFSNGKVIGLLGFTHPKGMLLSVVQGGKVPEGMQIPLDVTGQLAVAQAAASGANEVPHEACSFQYVDWKNETFWRSDMRAMHGKNLAVWMCDMDRGLGLATPWEGDEVPARATTPTPATV